MSWSAQEMPTLVPTMWWLKTCGLHSVWLPMTAIGSGSRIQASVSWALATSSGVQTTHPSWSWRPVTAQKPSYTSTDRVIAKASFSNLTSMQWLISAFTGRRWSVWMKIRSTYLVTITHQKHVSLSSCLRSVATAHTREFARLLSKFKIGCNESSFWLHTIPWDSAREISPMRQKLLTRCGSNGSKSTRSNVKSRCTKFS